MNILIVSATLFEIKTLLDFLEIESPTLGIYHSKKTKYSNIHVVITGIGMVNTAFSMGRYITNNYDLIINTGVCGAFDKTLELGKIVHIETDVLSELGAENGEEFLTYDQLKLDGRHIFYNKLTISNPLINHLKKVKGITVNTVHGNENSIAKIKHLYQPDVESMEGAAFLACCNESQKNYTQIRAISNYVEKRDKSKWQMPLAIKHLNDFLIELINSFNL